MKIVRSYEIQKGFNEIVLGMDELRSLQVRVITNAIGKADLETIDAILSALIKDLETPATKL